MSEFKKLMMNGERFNKSRDFILLQIKLTPEVSECQQSGEERIKGLAITGWQKMQQYEDYYSKQFKVHEICLKITYQLDLCVILSTNFNHSEKPNPLKCIDGSRKISNRRFNQESSISFYWLQNSIHSKGYKRKSRRNSRE